MSAPAAAQPSTPPLSTRAIVRVVLTVIACVLALYLIYLLRRPLTWIFIAGFIAIALSGPVAFLQRWMKRGSISGGSSQSTSMLHTASPRAFAMPALIDAW